MAVRRRAQDYPSRPIKMIVSIAAGSVTDVIMRTAAGRLQQQLGQPVMVENLGGASGIVAGQTCTQADPDGYTICVIYHSTMSYNPLLFSNLPYDADKDFAPVTRLFWLIEGVFVPTSLGVNSVAELKTLAQSKPNGLNYGTLGEGSFPDLFLRWLNNQWHTQIVGIPYKGGGPAAQAIAANEVQITRFGVGNFMGLIQGGTGQSARGHLGAALAAVARRADFCRGRLGRLSAARAGGASPRPRARRRASLQSSTANSSSCSPTRNSPRSSTRTPWSRRRRRRKALPNSSRRIAGGADRSLTSQESTGNAK